MLSVYKKAGSRELRAGVALAEREFAMAVISPLRRATPILEHCALHNVTNVSLDQSLTSAIGSYG